LNVSSLKNQAEVVMMKNPVKVLIAGIGGASLGTEILKCLLMARQYRVFGCDISKLAFGHYQNGFEKTFVVNSLNYIDSIMDICTQLQIGYVIPGGEEPMILLNQAAERFKKKAIALAMNSSAIIDLFSNKKASFDKLSELGVPIPITKTVSIASDLDDMPFPCVIKPATGSGGSNFLFLAGDKEEALVYIKHLLKNSKLPLVQEYIPEDEGEFTVGVLSLPDGSMVKSIVLKRVFDSKLSIKFKGGLGLISSGYSQGLIDAFPEICAAAEIIATSINSRGPINIQGRMRKGRFIPFEINPRFSASTYLRAMAGFNEIDIFLQYLINGQSGDLPINIKPGYYLRSFSESYVSMEDLKDDSLDYQ
jgi:carbamoyl-phosphate synthase large subunit